MNNPKNRPESQEDEAATNETGKESEAGRPLPSWFPQAANANTEELADRYRAIRQPDDRPQLRPTMPRQETIARKRYYREFPHEADERALTPMRTSMRGVYAIAGLLAVFAGGATGLVFANIGNIAAGARSLAAGPVQTNTIRTAAAPRGTTIAKKLVPTATLDVADVSGSLNSYIPLMLHAQPAIGGEDIALKVSGLPKEAYLTAGSKTQDDSWVLKLDDIDGVKLVVPRTEAPSFDVAVAAVETDSGELAAPVKEMKVAINDPSLKITPASAEPDTQVNQLPVSKPIEPQAAFSAVPDAAVELLKKGDNLLAAGDMSAARQFYERAFTLGAAAGALGVAKTYDPAVYKVQNVQGIAPDPAQAMAWYQKAAAAGQSDAGAAIETLKASAQ